MPCTHVARNCDIATALSDRLTPLTFPPLSPLFNNFGFHFPGQAADRGRVRVDWQIYRAAGGGA